MAVVNSPRIYAAHFASASCASVGPVFSNLTWEQDAQLLSGDSNVLRAALITSLWLAALAAGVATLLGAGWCPRGEIRWRVWL